MSKIFGDESSDSMNRPNGFAVFGPAKASVPIDSMPYHPASTSPKSRRSRTAGPVDQRGTHDSHADSSVEVVSPDSDLAAALATEGLQIPVVREAWHYLALKRTIDLVGATLGLIVLSPLALLCCVLIKLQDGGPIMFRQVRVGKQGRSFEILKFRSMVVQAEAMQSDLFDLNEHDDDRTFKILNDPRITPVGRFLRRMSLDELPQLWNVLRGEMTLVGPRPALPREVGMYEEEHLMRLSVKPGLTCIWQVSGRSRLGFETQMAMDLEYIARRNTRLDLALIVRTVPAVLFGDGAA